jgi:hypothetical protein
MRGRGAGGAFCTSVSARPYCLLVCVSARALFAPALFAHVLP